MTSPAILSRMTSRTMIPNGEGFGGFAALSQTDVAHGLVGLRAGPTCLMRAMYARDYSDTNLKSLYIWSWQGAISIAITKDWDIPKGKEVLRNMAKLACSLKVFPQMTNCPHCSGTGAVQPNQHNTDGICPMCEGEKRFDYSAEELAETFGFSRGEWDSKWGPRFKTICQMVEDWHEQGCRNIHRRLSNG